LTTPNGVRTLAFDVTSGNLYFTTDVDHNLYRFDPVTQQATLIGSVGLNVSGLAADSTGRLFATPQAQASTLYELNTLTGAATVIGEMGTPIADLAFRPGDGALYGIPYGLTAADQRLFRINPVTAQVTVVGNFSISNLAMSGLAFDATIVPEPGSAMILGGMTLLIRRRGSPVAR
jgi:hypothetical protein